MNKQEVINLMTESPEGEEHFYPLTDQVGIYVVSIIHRNDKWYLNAWHDYHDFTAWETEIKEEDALEYLNYDINKNKKTSSETEIENAFEIFRKLLNDIPLDEQNIEELRNKYPILVNKIKEQVRQYNSKLFAIDKLRTMQRNLLFDRQEKIDAVSELINTITVETRNGQVISVGLEEINNEYEDDSFQDNIARRVLKVQKLLKEKTNDQVKSKNNQ